MSSRKIPADRIRPAPSAHPGMTSFVARMKRSEIRDHHPYIVMLILIEAAVIAIEAQSMIVIPDAQRQSGIQTEPDWIPGSRANPRAPRNDSFIEGSL
jgi:hypothetical protein